jgi:hypothetical protein
VVPGGSLSRPSGAGAPIGVGLTGG